MTRYKSQGFNNTFKNARKGFNLALKSEINIRVHVVVATLVLAAAVYLKFSAIEFALDSIYHNRYSRMVGMAKDISAGAVMFATVISVCIGLILYGSKIIPLLQ